ncbi:MAG: tRNA (adenosine(37)-N6)-threonylcarbamoyltransferase complex dimerization subunit type 1 TsaB [Candidatus Eisenbacteria bacterium]|nr:tRNA (adenosine(37)-N6)-threonylcarbamoyltransferase complex dimerization subunit type 1 TsaB [Candidatus Eisenbacteria bacterium]
MIIAIETSATFGSVAAVEEGSLRAEECMFVPQGHCESVLPMLERMLSQAGIEMSSADAIAVSLGPGSFTALRIGLSTAKALSFSLGKPLVGVGTLDVIAYNVVGLCQYVCPIIDAKRGEVFYSLYRDGIGRQEKLVECRAAHPEKAAIELCSLLATMAEGNVAFLGDGVGLCREFVETRIGGRSLFPPYHLGIPRASCVGMLALDLLRQGKIEDVERVEPIYVRRSDAELRKERI